MSASLLAVFEQYQKARVTFVQAVADAAQRPQNVETMQNAGVLQLLRPLLLDNIPSIQQTAATALGRLANVSDDLAEAVVRNDILPQLVFSLGEKNRYYKKSAAFVLRAVAKHSAELAQAVVDSGALEPLVLCLEEFDPTVKEAAAWALGYISQHTPELAQSVVDAGAVPLLVLCLQEPEVSLKRITASTLSDLAKHSAELAQSVVDAGAVAYIAPLIGAEDSKLRRQACVALAQVAKHSVELAEVCVEAEIFPRILACLADVDLQVRKNGAACVREVVKHSPELAKLVVNAGGAAALVDFIKDNRGEVRLPGIMALGYICATSETLALAAIVAKAVPALKDALLTEPEEFLKSATVWTLGQMGKHTSEHSHAVADAALFHPLVTLLNHAKTGEDLRAKCSRTLHSLLSKSLNPDALAPLLREDHPKVQELALGQFAELLPGDPALCERFMAAGLLQRVQEIKAVAEPHVLESIERINAAFPEEAVRFSDPATSKRIIAELGARVAAAGGAGAGRRGGGH